MGTPRLASSAPPLQATPPTIPRESGPGPGDPNTIPQAAAAAEAGRGCTTNHSKKFRGTTPRPSLGPNFELLTQVGWAEGQSRPINLIYKSDRCPPCQVASSVHFGMKAFDNLERLLECFIISTETPQHVDDLIAHSKVRLKSFEFKGRIPAQSFNLITSISLYCQVLPAHGEVGGADRGQPQERSHNPQVIHNPSLLLNPSCLIKVSKIVFLS